MKKKKNVNKIKLIKKISHFISIEENKKREKRVLWSCYYSYENRIELRNDLTGDNGKINVKSELYKNAMIYVTHCILLYYRNA